MKMSRLGLFTFVLLLGVSACCNLDATPSTSGPEGSPTAKGKPAATPTAKTETGRLVSFLPSDGAQGSTRTVKADRPDYAEAEYKTDDNKKLTVSISDLSKKPAEVKKFAAYDDRVDGYPYLKIGNNRSLVLVSAQMQVEVVSNEVDEATRKTFIRRTELGNLAGYAKWK